MSRLHRGVVYLFVFSLAAAALLAQGSRPAPPSTPISGGATAAQVVDRTGAVVGTLSQHTGLVFTLPDGRHTLLGWSRNGLGNAAPIAFSSNGRPIIHFLDATCSGDAYVEFRSTHLPGDPMALILSFEGPPPSGPQPWGEGEEPPMFLETRTLYASENGARALLRAKQNFQSHYSMVWDPAYPTMNPCRAGLDPQVQFDPQNPYLVAYLFKKTTVDLTSYEWPFHVVE